MDLRVREWAVAERVHHRCRAARWATYCGHFPPRPGERVLDVGVSPLVGLPDENFFLRRYPYPDQVTAVSNDPRIDPVREAFPAVTVEVADALALPYTDASFDVVHSNAVIEHVGPLDAQARFMAEIVRVARAGMISTPSRWFPVDSHTNLPFAHWLPRPLFLRALTRLGRRAPGQEWITWLLSAREFRRLVPPEVTFALVSQRLVGMPAVHSVVFTTPGARHAAPAAVGAPF